MVQYSATTLAESTRTTLFGIFVVAEHPLTTGQIIALAKALGISATNVKSHLTRMVADGTVRRAGRRRFARYSPASNGQDLIQGISARLDVQRDRPWDGRWLVLMLQLPSARNERSRVRDSLWFDGFRPWSPEIYLRPAWPRQWALMRGRAYVDRGLAFCVQGEVLGAVNWRRVRAMYRLGALDRAAARLANEINAAVAGNRSGAEAFAARLKVGGRVARLVAHDPRLPPAVWKSQTGMRDLRTAYRRFENKIGSRAQEFVDRVLGAAADARR
jgi:DNA-binding transcriptional regulator PaaX